MQEWINNGFYADMEWIKRTLSERSDCCLLWPEVRSLIIVALNYYPGEVKENPFFRFGRVARYAWGLDYHSTIKARLKRLAEAVQNIIPGSACRAYCDDGPVAEKLWAAKAGVGWIGKHSLLITPEFGSWVVLGVLMINRTIEPDFPVADQCGSCQLCMDHCPSKAIVRPYLVDARRCLSYWTIEKKGELSLGQGSLMDSWIFGCDLCQEICPHNRTAIRTTEKDFQPIADKFLNPRELLYWTEDQYLNFFKGNSLARIGRIRLLRNIIMAMGSSHNPEFISFLYQAIHDREILVRKHAGYALSCLNQDDRETVNSGDAL